MKRILSSILLLSLFGCLQAQSPELFNYQGIARDVAGAPISNEPIGLRLTIRSGSASGPIEYQDTHTDSTNQFGLLNIKVGMGTVISGSMSSVSWGADTHFLEVEMDPAGGTSYTLSGVNQLISVPYALHAASATDVDDADADPTNEIQILSTAGDSILLSDGGGFAVLPPDMVDDADADPANEFNDSLSLSGNLLQLSDGGGTLTADLGSISLNDSDWTVSGGNLTPTDTTLNVGIGTATPWKKLTVVDGEVMIQNRPGITTSANLHLYQDNASSGGRYSISSRQTGEFAIYDQTSSKNRIWLDTAGTIGLGSTDPIGLVEIKGNSNLETLVLNKTGGVTDDLLGLYRSGVRQATIGALDDGRVFLYHDGIANWGWYFTASGNFGLRTNSATAVLSVNGSANKTGGGSWAVFSDRRLKKDVRPYSEGLTAILQIDPVRFRYNGKAGIDDTEKEYVGIIAQEMQKLAPHTVRTVHYNNPDSGEKGEYLEFDPSSMDFMLVNAIKELKGMVDDLKQENEAIKEELKQLKAEKD